VEFADPFLIATGTVIVPWESFFCITMCLPRRRTSMNPCLAKMEHTSWPERTRSLLNCHLNLGYENLAMKTLLDLFG
jgi:hypothetical protein